MESQPLDDELACFLDSSLEWSALSVAACDNEGLEDWLGAWEYIRISDRGKGGECPNRKEQTKKK